MTRVFCEDGFQHLSGGAIFNWWRYLRACRGSFPSGFLFYNRFQGGQFTRGYSDGFTCYCMQPFQLFFAETTPVAVLLVEAINEYGGRMSFYHFL